MKPKLLTIPVHSDHRGSLTKFFGTVLNEELDAPFNIQEVYMTTNHLDVLRGLHFQVNPNQEKIIQCVKGQVNVRVVNLDPTSPELGTVYSYTLKEDDGQRIYIPALHGLGYLSTSTISRVLYLANADFSAEGDTGVDPFDPTLNIDWGHTDKSKIILSNKDLELDSYEDYLLKARSF